MTTSPGIHLRPSTAVAAAVLLLSLSVTAPADPQGMQAFGINEHFLRYTDYLASADEVIASGVKWVRISSEWGSLEPTRGQFDLAALDALVDRLNSKGVSILFTLGYTAPWASSQPNLSWPDVSRYKPANWADWENYVQTITSHYNGKITYWEVWNEPDHPAFWKSSIDDYNELLTRASAKIRAANPANKVLIGGLALFNGTSDSYGLGTFFDLLLGKGAASSFDIINYHAYGNSTHFLQLYNGMQPVIAKYALLNRKIWITETGFSTAGDSNLEPRKADRVDQTAITHGSLPGIERVFWYVCRNIAPIGNPSEENFGLEGNNRAPLKAYPYYQAEGGASTDFALQKSYPTQTSERRTLACVPLTSGDGSSVTDYVPDGSIRKIASGTYMYFKVQDNWILDSNAGLDSAVSVDVTYWDSATGSCTLQYDGNGDIYSNLSRTNTGRNRYLTKTFVLDDARFANRQNNASDFRLYASGADLIVSNVTINRRMNMAKVILGNVDRFRLMERADDPDPGHIGYAPVATMGGTTCRLLQDGSKYLFFTVCDGLAAAGDTQLEIGVQFWDAGTDVLVLRYNALGGIANKGITIQKTNTNTWRYVVCPVTDANFTNALSYFADFCLHTGSDNLPEYIRSVDVRKTKIKAVLGGTDKFRLVTNTISSDPADETYAPLTTMEGESCRQLTGNSKYLYFQVADGFIRPETTNVSFYVRYWDSGTDTLTVHYNAIGNSYKSVAIAKTGSGSWKTAKLTVTDANFNNTQNYFSDFRVSNGWDTSQEYIGSVEVAVP